MDIQNYTYTNIYDWLFIDLLHTLRRECNLTKDLIEVLCSAATAYLGYAVVQLSLKPPSGTICQGIFAPL
jgi:hypothetical protein